MGTNPGFFPPRKRTGRRPADSRQVVSGCFAPVHHGVIFRKSLAATKLFGGFLTNGMRAGCWAGSCSDCRLSSLMLTGWTWNFAALMRLLYEQYGAPLPAVKKGSRRNLQTEHEAVTGAVFHQQSHSYRSAWASAAAPFDTRTDM